MRSIRSICPRPCTAVLLAGGLGWSLSCIAGDPPAPPPSSAPGDYINDCIQIATSIPDTELKSGTIWQVTDQSSTASNDRTLTLVPARFPLPINGVPPCKGTLDKANKQQTVAASKLFAAGAYRYGWTYGVLTMPYKYYPRLHSFQGSAPIGGYLGWRTGQAGSGMTWAGTVTLSSVKADTVAPKTLVDGKPQVTGTTDVAALSFAGGWIFDLSKSQGASPFKAGFFIGVDRVNTNSSINYKYNNVPWLAIQLGYDFTSN